MAKTTKPLIQGPEDLTAKAVRDQPRERKRTALAAAARVSQGKARIEAVLRDMVESAIPDDQARRMEAQAKMMRRWREPKDLLDAELTTTKKALTSLTRGLALLENFEPDQAASKRGRDVITETRRRLQRIERALKAIDVRPQPKRGAPSFLDGFYDCASLAIDELSELGVKPVALAAEMAAECLRPLLPYRTAPAGKTSYEFTGKSLLWTIRKHKRAGQAAGDPRRLRQDFTARELERARVMVFGGDSFGPDQVRAILAELDGK